MTRSYRSGVQHACGHCDARWFGRRTCHCGSCHRTFTGVGPFDAHRRQGICVDPTAAGLVDAGRIYPCWGTTRDRDEDDA